MKIGLSILVAGVLVFASCTSDQKRIAYVAKIDNLSAVLQKDATAFESIDTVLIFFNLKNMNSQLAAYDSIDSLSITLEKIAYSELKQSFSSFLEESPQVIEEAKICKSQLDNLRFDAENKLIHNDELQRYFEQESMVVAALQNKMELFQKRINSQLKNYELLNPKIGYLIDSLSQN